MIIVLAGPSSVGKTTFASKKYKNYYVIDSDEIWFKLYERYNRDREKTNKNLFKEIVKIALEKQNSVIVHTDPKPFEKFLKGYEYKIIVLATNFKNLARNISKRKDYRPVDGVLGNSHTGYLFYFKVSTEPTEKSLFLRKKDLELMPVRNKKDIKAIEKISAKFFKDKETARVIPKIKFDDFIVVK